MEIQKQFDHSLYIVLQLLLKKHNKRALYIIEHMQSQGYGNNQLAVLKSYALSKLKDQRAALECLQYCQGPLVSLARGQYLQHMAKWKQVQANWDKMAVEGKEAPIDNFIKSNSVLQGSTVNVMSKTEHQKLILLPCDRNCLQAVNELTTQYTHFKQLHQNNHLSTSDYQNQCLQLAEDYKSLLQKYRPKGHLKTAICQFHTFLSQSN